MPRGDPKTAGSGMHLNVKARQQLNVACFNIKRKRNMLPETSSLPVFLRTKV